MRCSPNDFIEINDNSGQNAVRFYVLRIKRRRELTTGETEKESERERAYERGRWHGYKDQDILINNNGNII